MLKKVQKKNILPEFEEMIKAIENGQEYVIMDANKAVAKIVKLTRAEKTNFQSSQTDHWTADDFKLPSSDE